MGSLATMSASISEFLEFVQCNLRLSISIKGIDDKPGGIITILLN
jgi:hypothetical protein